MAWSLNKKAATYHSALKLCLEFRIYEPSQWRSQYRGKGGRVPPLTAKKFAKNQEKRGKIGKNQEKIGKKEEKSGMGWKGKNREDSSTLPLLTERAGYASEPSLISYADLQSATPDSNKFAKNRGKEGQNQEKSLIYRILGGGENQEEKAKIGKVLSLCPSWQIGLATLLHVVVGSQKTRTLTSHKQYLLSTNEAKLVLTVTSEVHFNFYSSKSIWTFPFE